jgi:hypothetical protein
MMPINNAFASLAVKDMKSALSWYERILDRPADSAPMLELAEWIFNDGGRLQVYRLPERAGACSCTLAVSNLETEIAKLDALGIDTGQQLSNNAVKTVMITDPDGNHIALVEAFDHRIAR